MSIRRSDRQPSARGDATRDRLLASAIDLFGKRGYEGVGAREIAAAARVPLSALPYHFKTKETLYKTAVGQVLAQLSARLEPAIQTAAAALAAGQEEAAAAIGFLQGELLDVLAVEPEAAGWAKLLLREHLDPGPAYELVYEDAGRGAVELLAALIAKAEGHRPDDPATLIKAFARMGEVLAFRTLQVAVGRRLGWEQFGAEEASLVREVLAKL